MALQESKILTRWHQIHHCQESEELWARKNILENFQKRRDTILRIYLTRILLNRLAERNLINGIQSIGEECYHRAWSNCVGLSAHGSDDRSNQNPHFLFNPRLTQLELMRAEELIENWYEVQRNLSFRWLVVHMEHLTETWVNPKLTFVNA